MSYLTDLHNLVTEGTAAATVGPKRVDPKVMYSALLDSLTSKALWVTYDQYSMIADLDMSSSPELPRDHPISRIDLHPTPVVSVPSAKMLALVQLLCSNTGVGFLSRSSLVANLAARNTKMVLAAGLRSYEPALHKCFSRKDFPELHKQQRGLVFPLEQLTKRAGVDLSDFTKPRSKQ